ncbi:hypothetical protein PsorP6_012864 [Peronosclerospora sorghi]|uniref:Uncharacterized protein n=1 Tax=Peronosclerospora sorghi TaxID=230839 RepID=A0ACC0WIZ7_9STRA|nr:hypothetical protein PsorP6_012864 [Peronosclerospora sorghi]
MVAQEPKEEAEPPPPEKSAFLKLFWTLAESERTARVQAAAQLLRHLKHSAKQDTEVQYTVKRLVRGLASSRDAARQGFSTALSGLLTSFPKQLTLRSTHELLRDAMEVHSSMKPMEQREHMFGRLFGLLALHRSGRLSADVPLLVTVIKELLEMALFKRWFREACYESVLSLLPDVPGEVFFTDLAAPIHNALHPHPSKGEERVEAWNADQVLLAVGVQRYLHFTGIDQDQQQMKTLPLVLAASNALQRHHIHLLARPLHGSSGCYPRVHTAWLGVFGSVLNPSNDGSTVLDTELLQETWTVLVENSLVGSSSSDDSAPTSHERQGLAIKLFELVVPKLPASALRAILTPRFVRCLYINAVAKKNYLHEAARHCVKSFAACAPIEFFHFFREQFMSPLSILVPSTSGDSDEEADKPLQKEQTCAEDFNALVEIEEKKEREEALKRRTDRARVWTLEILVAALSEMLSAKHQANSVTEDQILRFLVFHSFYTPCDDAKVTPSKRKRKNQQDKKVNETEIDTLAQEASKATPVLSENVANYAKTRLFTLLSVGLAGSDGASASESVLRRIFAIANDMQENSTVVSLRDPFDEEVTTQFQSLVNHVKKLVNTKVTHPQNKSKKATTRRPLSEMFLLLFMSAGLQLLDGEQRDDGIVVAADLEKCYSQLVGRETKAPAKKKKKEKEQDHVETADESVVVLTDLLLSLLSQDSSALRGIVSEVFRSLLPLLNSACLTTMMNVLQPTVEAEGAAGVEEENDEFTPIRRGETEVESEEEEEEEVVLSSADALTDALRDNEKLAALHQEDLALAAIVGQVKLRSQRKKDLERAQLQTMHFQLRVLDLLQMFVSQRPEGTEAAVAKHHALVISLMTPLFRVLIRLQSADRKQYVLRDRLQAVLLHKVLRIKDKVAADNETKKEARDVLRQIVDLIRSTPMDKDHSSKVASAAIVYLVRVLCSGGASMNEEVHQIMYDTVVDAFTKKHSRFPRASFNELLTKSPAIGIQVLLKPLAAIAAVSEKKETYDQSDVPPAIDEFSKSEVFRLLTVLLRCSRKLQRTSELPHAPFNGVSTSLKTALVRQLAIENVQQLKSKRMKVVMLFALQLVKFWHMSDENETMAHVREVVKAVQAIEFKSPVVKGMAKQIAEAAGMPFVCSDNGKTDKKALVDQDMPEHLEAEAKTTITKKRKENHRKTAKVKQKKRKQSVSGD